VTGWDSAGRTDRDAFTRYFRGMIRRGVYLAPSPFEALFLSAAHTEAEIDATADAARAALREVF